ncbi:hypothetical protein HPP92_000011 [Vanilla planifolia]|uniref:Transmembrane protein n=1 Tax=Vanilla planifolia TaxID=51239 RepID=A0A835RX76_VANPL|nr:hypothetical protein HPP92_000011 [Vanilla planifolia]
MAKAFEIHSQERNLLLRSLLSTNCSSSSSSSSCIGSRNTVLVKTSSNWKTLCEQLRCRGRHYCFLNNGRKQDQARKALESALGEKKIEFERWNKEIEKREEKGIGGTSGHGGWFGGGRWFGWFGGEHFWEETRQASLAIIGIISLCLLVAKGNVMFAVASNSLLFCLRGVRNLLSFQLTSLNKQPASGSHQVAVEKNQSQLSAKQRVVRKWGMD